MQAGSIGSYGLCSARKYAVRFVNRTLSIARALGASSNALPSDALATLWPALEGILVSPCSPATISLCAGQVSGALAATLRTGCLRARWRPRGQRHDARGSREHVRTGCRGEQTVFWALRALWVACGGDPASY